MHSSQTSEHVQIAESDVQFVNVWAYAVRKRLSMRSSQTVEHSQFANGGKMLSWHGS